MGVLILTGAGVVAGAAVPTEQDLEQAKGKYEEVWQYAAEANGRKAQLEKQLQGFQQNIEVAKADFAKLTARRVEMRKKIVQVKKLIDTVLLQMKEAEQSKQFYASINEEQTKDLVTFIRYIAARELEVTDTGPVIGGTVMRRVIRGSLGDLIEQDLSRQALLAARQKFLHELTSFVDHSLSAQERLSRVKAGLDAELKVLMDRYAALDEETERSADVLDDSWMAKVLTEQEIAQVIEETDEVNARISEMQQSLLDIDRQLKTYKISQLKRDLDSFNDQKREISRRKDTLLEKEERLLDADDAQLKAYADAQALRNTDSRNVYKDIELTKLKITNNEAVLIEKEQAIATIAAADRTQPGWQEQYERAVREREAVQAELSRLARRLALLEHGIPADAADEYLRLKSLWDIAAIQLIDVQAEIKDVNAELARVSVKVSDTIGIIEGIRDGKLTLNPMGIASTGFIWPVKGRITAGYLDSAYVKVFRVPHRAIDIAVKQGTKVQAAADGIVYHVKPGGAKGYTYVLIGHRDGYATIYGHLSAVFVQKGDIIFAGQAIGLSGGIPGTVGAGSMTTGAHLHFELMQNGKHVDPRTVLP